MKLTPRSLAPLLALGAVACGPDIPDGWKEVTPTEGLTMAFGDEDDGKIKKVVLNYDKKKIEGDALRAKFGEKLKPQGFTQLSECVSPNGTSSAIFVGKDKEIFQVIINRLGEDMYDVELQRTKELPGVALPNPETCKFVDGAKEHCEMQGEQRCKLK